MVIGTGGSAPPAPKLVGGAVCRAEPSATSWGQGLVAKPPSRICCSPPPQWPGAQGHDGDGLLS